MDGEGDRRRSRGEREVAKGGGAVAGPEAGVEDGVADADGVVLGDGVDLVPYVGVLIELDPLDGSVAAVNDQGAALRVGDVGEGEADPAEVAALEGLAFGVV